LQAKSLEAAEGTGRLGTKPLEAAEDTGRLPQAAQHLHAHGGGYAQPQHEAASADLRF